MNASVRAEGALDRDIEFIWRLQHDADEEDWDDDEDEDWDEDWDEDEDWDDDEDEDEEDWNEDEDGSYGKRPRPHPDEWH